MTNITPSNDHWVWFDSDGEMKTIQDDMEIMQFTGLLDCNGAEVFEGDVVKGKYYESGSHRFIGEVIFECGSWWVRGVKKYREYRQLKDVHNVQVIGNIHQQPELLK